MLEDSIGFRLGRTYRRVSQLLAGAFEPYGITPEQWSVLQRVIEEDGINQKELAKRVEKDQTNVTRILDQLERKGLVQRRQNPSDRRSFLTYGTEKGFQLSGGLVPIEAAVIASVLEGLSDAGVEALREGLDHIWQNASPRHFTEED